MSDGSPVYVVGGGGVGLFFAHALEQAGRKVAICVRTPVERFVFETAGRDVPLAARSVISPDGLAPAEWLILTTKAQDTAGAASWLKALVGPGTRIVVAQNGIDHAERVRPFAPNAVVIPALVFAGIELVGRGSVRHHSGSRVDVPAGTPSDELAELLAGSHLEITRNPDFVTGAWRKLMNNTVGNPITALTLRRGEVFHDPDIQRLSRAMLQETVAVGCAEGAKLGQGDIDNLIEFLAGIPPNGGTSMLYDRLAGRPLEFEYLTGALVKAAARHGIAVPLNDAVLTLVKALSAKLKGSQADAVR